MPDEILQLSNGRTVQRWGAGDVNADLEDVADMSLRQLFAEALRTDAAAGADVAISFPLAEPDPVRGRLAGVGLLVDQRDVVFAHPRDGGTEAAVTGAVILPAVHDPQEALARAGRAARPTVLSVRAITPYVDNGLKTFELKCTVDASTTVATVVDGLLLVQRALVRRDARPATPTDVIRELEDGTWGALVGLHESPWFEAKGRNYGLDDGRQKLELALDVSSLANQSAEGLVLIGCATAPDEFGRDAVTHVRGFPLSRRPDLQVPRIVDVIAEYVYPRIQGLSVRVFTRDDRALICIHVPTQFEGTGPFIVKGHLDESGGYRGTGFSWVERHGSSKRAVSIADIQARLRTERVQSGDS